MHRWYGVYVSHTLLSLLCVFSVAMVFVCVNKCHVTWELTKGKSICCQFGFYGSQRIHSTLSDLYLFVCFTLLVVFSPFSFRYVLHTFFPLFHAESKFCMFASLYVLMVVWLSVNIFFSRTFLLLYCIPLWFTWARERVIEVKKMTAKRFKVHFPHRFLSLTLYCEISQNQTLWLGNDYIYIRDYYLTYFFFLYLFTYSK